MNAFTIDIRHQNKAMQNLGLLFQGRMPTAVILSGPAGIGKRLSVRRLFQKINCLSSADQPCGACLSCKKIFEKNHVDLIEIQPEGEVITVDTLRAMQKKTYFAPIDSKHRFIVIDQAHQMNSHSSNALLKTLEEPPTHTHFFLITNERSRLSATVTSRCQFVRFSPLSDDALCEILKQSTNGVFDRDAHGFLLPLLAGGLDRASLIFAEATLEALGSAYRELSQARNANGVLFSKIVEKADALQKEMPAEIFELYLDLLSIYFHNQFEPNLRARDSEAAFENALNVMSSNRLRARLAEHGNKKLLSLAASELSSRGSPR